MKRRDRGAFLVDALCAGAVLAILATVAFAGMNARRAGAREELEATRARYFAFSMLEQVRARARMGIVASGSHDVPTGPWHLPEGTTARCRIEPAADGTRDLWAATAVVRWPAARGADGTIARWREARDHTWIHTSGGGTR